MRLKIKQADSGFTLIEAVVVIAITGLVAAVTAVFIRRPVQVYFDTIRRAELTDTADSALRRMTRDIQRALPNSVRITASASDQFLEFVPMLSAGRYRAETGGNPAAGNPLDFNNAADNSFDVLGPPITIAAGNFVVVFNLGQPESDVYAGTSRRAAAAPFGTLNTVTFTPQATPFPFLSFGNRFQIVGTAVSYYCHPDAANPANGFLYRYSGYAIPVNQPVTKVALDGLATGRVLATNVSACNMTMNPGPQISLAVLSIRLAVSNNAPTLETVDLLHQINVDNTP